MKNLPRVKVQWRVRADVLKVLQTIAKNSDGEFECASQVAEQILVERTMRWNKRLPDGGDAASQQKVA